MLHKWMELEEERDDEACEVEEESSSKHTCQECGVEFKKPAHLKQHMHSHSLEVDLCRRPDITSGLKKLKCRTVIFIGDQSPFSSSLCVKLKFKETLERDTNAYT